METNVCDCGEGEMEETITVHTYTYSTDVQRIYFYNVLNVYAILLLQKGSGDMVYL